MAQLCSTLCEPMDRSLEVYSSLFMGFSWQEYWSELLFPPPGESSQPRDRTCVFSVSCIADSLSLSQLGSPIWPNPLLCSEAFPGKAQRSLESYRGCANQGPYHQGHHSLHMESHLHKYLSSWTLNPASIHTKCVHSGQRKLTNGQKRAINC